MDVFSECGVQFLPGFCSAESADLLAEEIYLFRDVPHLRALQCPDGKVVGGNSFGVFGIYDAALRYWMPKIEMIVGEPLVPMNSYGRIYLEGATLASHSDEPYLEIGVSLCLRRSEIDWPLCIKTRQGSKFSVVQKPGDALLYEGALSHWREGQLLGTEHANVFLHFCRAAGPYAETHRYRQRQHLGMRLVSEVGCTRRVARRMRRSLRRLIGKYRR